MQDDKVCCCVLFLLHVLQGVSSSPAPHPGMRLLMILADRFDSASSVLDLIVVVVAAVCYLEALTPFFKFFLINVNAISKIRKGEGILIHTILLE